MYIVNLIEDYLDQDSTQKEIEIALEVVCEFLPENYQATCEAFFEAGIPQIVEWIEQYENASVVCSQMGLCSSSSEIVKPLIVKPADSVCDACTFLLNAVESWVESNRTITEIQNYLDTLCNLIPGYSQVCDAMVDYELPTIIQWLENTENPHEVCTQLGLCSSSKNMMMIKVNGNQLGDNCVLCQFVVSSAEAWLEANATEAQIEQYLEVLCNTLPSGLAEECDSIVETEVPMIIQYLKQNYTPQQICQKLGFCSSSKLNLDLKHKVKIN